MTTEQNRIACNKWRASHRDYYNAYDREYKKKLHRQRRTEYMEGRSCPYCGSTENLEIHHVYPDTKDPELKKYGHTDHIWGWCEERRIMELLFCEPVCKSCHDNLHAKLKKGEI